MDILVACEESQRVCLAFREKGHNAYSCDLLDCSGGAPQYHIKGDVLPLLNGFCLFVTQDGEEHVLYKKWDMIIAFPPCIYMCKASARFMYPKAGFIDTKRLHKAIKAKKFFMKILSADCPKICIENPTPLKVVGLPKPSQIVQPYFFGDPYSKRTLLWEKNLPPLIPTQMLEVYSPYVPSNTSLFSKGFGGSCGVAYDSKTRSKTFYGIARAMAEQWG